MNNNPQPMNPKDKPIHVEVLDTRIGSNGAYEGIPRYIYTYTLKVQLESARELHITFSTYTNTPQEIIRVLNTTIADMERIEAERQQLSKEINSLLMLEDIDDIVKDIKGKL